MRIMYLQVTSYKLKAASHKLQAARYASTKLSSTRAVAVLPALVRISAQHATNPQPVAPRIETIASAGAKRSGGPALPPGSPTATVPPDLALNAIAST